MLNPPTKHPKYEKIDVSNWDFGFGDLDATIAKNVSEALENSFDDTPPDLQIPIKWKNTGDDDFGGPPPNDPLTVYISLPLFGHDHGPVWITSFENLVLETLWVHQGAPHSLGFNNKLESGHEIIKSIRDALRILADKIDETLSI